jgi:FolB domain-containing protein
MSSDTLTIDSLRVTTHIGVPEEERRDPQLLEITVRFPIPKGAGKTDDFVKTIDYAHVAEEIKAIAAARPRLLIETLGEDIATGLLQTFGLKKIELGVAKFILPDTRCVRLSLKRSAKKKKKPAAAPPTPGASP